MRFRSEAQRRKFAELVKQGKMTQQTFDEWNGATKGKLPDKVKPKKASGPKSLLRKKHTPI